MGTHLEDEGLDDREDSELRRGSLSDHAAVADQDDRSTKVAIHQGSSIDGRSATVWRKVRGEQDVDLHCKHRNDERESDGTHTILLQKSHQVAEANEHHQSDAHVHLVDCGVVGSVLRIEEADPANDLDDGHEDTRQTRVGLWVRHGCQRDLNGVEQDWFWPPCAQDIAERKFGRFSTSCSNVLLESCSPRRLIPVLRIPHNNP